MPDPVDRPRGHGARARAVCVVAAVARAAVRAMAVHLVAVVAAPFLAACVDPASLRPGPRALRAGVTPARIAAPVAGAPAVRLATTRPR